MELWKRPNANAGRRYALAETLIQIDRAKAKPVLEWLEQQMMTAGVVQYQATTAMCRVDPKNPKVLTTVLSLVDQSSKPVAAQGMDMLALLGPEAKSALPKVRLALKDAHTVLRVRAAVALWKIEGTATEALPVLTAALAQTDTVDYVGPGVPPTLRFAAQYAATALGDMGAAAKSALPALRDAQGSGDYTLRNNATTAIRKIEKAKQ
jgi:hypothetical protein